MEAGGKYKNREIYFMESGGASSVSPFCQNHFTIIPDSNITPGLQMLFSVICRSWYFNATFGENILHQNSSSLQPGFQQILLSKKSFGLRHNSSKSADSFQHI